MEFVKLMLLVIIINIEFWKLNMGFMHDSSFYLVFISSSMFSYVKKKNNLYTLFFKLFTPHMFYNKYT